MTKYIHFWMTIWVGANTGIEELTAAILHTLIDKIIVHQAEEIDGERVQKIEIYYKFVGKFDDEQDV